MIEDQVRSDTGIFDKFSEVFWYSVCNSQFLSVSCTFSEVPMSCKRVDIQDPLPKPGHPRCLRRPRDLRMAHITQ